jgi:hypothetical protein
MEFVPLDDKFPEVVAKLIQCLVPVGGLQPDPRSDAGSSVPHAFRWRACAVTLAPRCSGELIDDSRRVRKPSRSFS